jgi:hypothetical protein
MLRVAKCADSLISHFFNLDHSMIGNRKQRKIKKNKLLIGGRGFVRLQDAQSAPRADHDQASVASNQPDTSDTLFLDHQYNDCSEEQSELYEETDLVQHPDTDLSTDKVSSATDHIEKVWRYIPLLQHYQLQITSDFQIHLINDFEIDANDQVRSKAGYAAVFVLNIASKNRMAPVACCSLCVSQELLAYFALQDFTDVEITEAHLFSCKHTTAVTQHTLVAYEFNCSIYNPLLASERLSTILSSYSTKMKSGWYTFNEAKHTKGILGVYVSNGYAICVFATQRKQTGTTAHYCFRCCKPACTHAQGISHELDAEIPDSIQTLRIPLVLDSLVSKDRYPCKFVANQSHC